MSYDNTSFYGDVLFDEYVDKCNFINPPTSTGFYVYHIVGDGFDSMSDMCTQFLNDYSILSANSSSLDQFWGVSYNMPRPLLYEGQKREYLFEDVCTSENNKSSGYVLNTGSYSFDNDGLTIDATTFSSSNYQANLRLDDSNVYDVPFTVEFDLLNDGNDNFRLYFHNTSFSNSAIGSGTLWTSPNGQTTKVRFEVTENGITRYINDTPTTLSLNQDVAEKVGVRFGYWQPTQSNIKIKNYKVYTGEDKERPLNDEEYKIYLYLRNCQLLTREDLEICLGNCFNIEDYSIKFSEEMHYLSTTNHLNYTPTITDTSNIQKNSDDDTYDYVIKQNSDDEEVNVIGGNLSETTETITVIEIPFNNWDNEFLSLIQQYISIKNNLEIKEYSL